MSMYILMCKKYLLPIQIQACQTSADFRGFCNSLGHSCDLSRLEKKIILYKGGGGMSRSFSEQFSARKLKNSRVWKEIFSCSSKRNM